MTFCQAATTGLRCLDRQVCEEGDLPTVRRQKITLACILSGAWFLAIGMGMLSWWAHQFAISAVALVSLIYYLGGSLATLLISVVLFRTKSLQWCRTAYMCITWLNIPVFLITHGGFQYNSSVGVAVNFNFVMGLILYESFSAAAASVALSCGTLLCWAVIEGVYGLPLPYVYDREALVIWHAVECILAPPFLLLALWYMLFMMKQEVLEHSAAEARAVATVQARASFVARMSHEIRSPVCDVLRSSVDVYVELWGSLSFSSPPIFLKVCRRQHHELEQHLPLFKNA